MDEKYNMTHDSLSKSLESLRRGRLLSDTKDRIWEEAWKRSRGDLSTAPGQKRGFFSSLRIPTLRLAVAFEFILILLLGSVGVVYAANQSIPGDVLYRVKRNTEAVWLELTPERKQTDVKLALLERRVQEIQQLAFEDRPIPETLQEEVTQTFSDIAAHPEKWEQAKTLSQVKNHVEALGMLSETYPETTAFNEVLHISLTAFEQLGGDVGTLSVPPSVVLTPMPTPTQPSEAPPEDNEPPGQDNDPPGQDNDPPGQDNDPPGQDNDPPGQDNEPPGQDNEPPGQDNEPPGQDNEPPGQDNNPPGQDNEPPGQDNDPPGQDNEPPGQDNEPLGQDNDPPGQDNEPPGQDNEPPGQDNDPPGQDNEPPGQGKP